MARRLLAAFLAFLLVYSEREQEGDLVAAWPGYQAGSLNGPHFSKLEGSRGFRVSVFKHLRVFSLHFSYLSLSVSLWLELGLLLFFLRDDTSICTAAARRPRLSPGGAIIMQNAAWLQPLP